MANKLLAMAFPILPGKTEDWKKFINELKGKRNAEFTASRQKLGVRERTFLQHTPMGDFVVVTLEGENPEKAFKDLGNGKDEFTKWFKAQVKNTNGVDFDNAPQGALPEQLIDSGRVLAHA